MSRFEKMLIIFFVFVGATLMTILFADLANIRKQTAVVYQKTTPLVKSVNNETTDKELWVVASQFEPVDYTGSLYVAQAHRPGEPENINRLVFIDTRACAEQPIRIPNTGDKFRVLVYSLRIDIGSPNIVSEKPASTMFFVRPPCQ